MDYTFDDILAELKKDTDWDIPEEVKESLLPGLAKALLAA